MRLGTACESKFPTESPVNIHVQMNTISAKEPFLGPRVFETRRWKPDWLFLTDSIASDPRAWSAADLFAGVSSGQFAVNATINTNKYSFTIVSNNSNFSFGFPESAMNTVISAYRIMFVNNKFEFIFSFLGNK